MKTVELSEGIRRITGKILTRFAPAPTGFLHDGHVLSAIYVWGIAALAGAGVSLRIEDHDRQRSRKEYEQSILEDLEWLGLFSSTNNPERLSRQSDREGLYSRSLNILQERHSVYPCFCSRHEIEKRHPGFQGEIPYDGFCRMQQKKAADQKMALLNCKEGRNSKSSLRLVFPGDRLEFFDAGLGLLQEIPETQCGDPVICDRKGNWSYQYSASFDDFDQGINLIIRGEDLLPSTARQVLLGRMMGRKHDAVFY
ncbi:MAG: glutamate--tRNA ligase family protein, partial [Spirochaetia bacterium]|nr:glutamate--tRNA ligase family protein [Spirochaetia bacterium]